MTVNYSLTLGAHKFNCLSYLFILHYQRLFTLVLTKLEKQQQNAVFMRLMEVLQMGFVSSKNVESQDVAKIRLLARGVCLASHVVSLLPELEFYLLLNNYNTQISHHICRLMSSLRSDSIHFSLIKSLLLTTVYPSWREKQPKNAIIGTKMLYLWVYSMISTPHQSQPMA